LLSWRLI